MTWVDLSAVFGYGTKLTSTQMQNLRDNIAAAFAKDSGAPELAALYVTQAMIAATAVGQAELKSTTGSVNTALLEGEDLILPGGQYGFYPQLKTSNAAVNAYWGWDADAGLAKWSARALGTTYLTRIRLSVSVLGHTAYAQQRYIQASGEVYWIFLLRDKVSKKHISGWAAPDHPCCGNGGKPLLVSHPFSDFDPAKHEIICITPGKDEVLQLQEACIVNDESQADRDILEVIAEDYEINEDSNPSWPDIPVTTGLPSDWREAYLERRPVEPVKKVIPKPDYILHRKLNP